MRFTEPAMRPPQEANSLLPHATQGCTYNKCKFCYVSRGYQFMAITPEELEQEIIGLKHYYPPDTKIYMTGSNPFALPAKRLKEYIGVFRKHYPHFSELGMQSRIDDISGKTDRELKELRELGLKHLYIGVESGNDYTLDLMQKGYSAQEAISQLHRLDEAGMEYTCFYVLGLAGKGNGKTNGKLTAEMFNQVKPRRITTTGITIFKNTPLADMVAKGEFTPPAERENIEELKEFLINLNIDAYYDGIHYLNPVNYRLAVADKKAKAAVLADIDDILSSYSDDELEKMVDRPSMQSL